MRPVSAGTVCVVMACSDPREADEVSRQLAQVDSACLVTYFRQQDLMLNSPAGKVAMVILATEDSPAALRGMLSWLRRRLPHCPITVVGDAGAGEYEQVAREGGAIFVVRPVFQEQWAAILSGVTRGEPVRAGLPA